MKTVNGDLIKLAASGEFDAIIHQANCFKTMGSGIAGLIASAFPMAQRADLRDVRNPEQRLGGYSWAVDENWDRTRSVIIGNLYGQFHPGPCTDYSALHSACSSFAKSPVMMCVDKIGLPMIGCGIGGGDWDIVSEIIEETFKDFDLTLVLYENRVSL